MNNRMTVAAAIFVMAALYVANLLGAEYFPPDLCMPGRLKQVELPFYSQVLAFMSEPALWPKAKDSRMVSYRFTYLRYRGSGEPVVWRLDQITKSKWILTVKEADYSSGKSGFRVNRQRSLTKDEIFQFQKLFTSLNFLELPTVGALEIEYELFDGSAWIFEAVYEGQYHFLRRRSPKDSERFWVSLPEYAKIRKEEGYPYIDKATNTEVNNKLVAMGEFLMKLSGLKLELF